MIQYTDGSTSEVTELKKLFEKSARKPEDIFSVFVGEKAKLADFKESLEAQVDKANAIAAFKELEAMRGNS